jgi:hypothetical protein
MIGSLVKLKLEVVSNVRFDNHFLNLNNFAVGYLAHELTYEWIKVTIDNSEMAQFGLIEVKKITVLEDYFDG